MKTNNLETIETIIKEYSWHSPITMDDLRRMLLEAQVATLESLKSSSVGQHIGGDLKDVIFNSEVDKQILDLEEELRIL